MTLAELKTHICNGTLSDDFLILVYEQNSFLVDQYINKLCEVKHCNINKITSLTEVTQSALALVMDYESDINILRTEVFEEVAPDYSVFKNCIVICNKVDKKIEPDIQEYLVTIKAPVDWQVQAYMQTVCPGLDKNSINALYLAAKKDIYRIDNELDKIKLFPETQQALVCSQIRFEPNSDLFDLPLLNLTNAIIAGDKQIALEYFRHEQFSNIEPFSVIGLLLGSYKKSLMLLYGTRLSVEDIGVSVSQANYIRKNNYKLSQEFLIKAVDFLSDLDYKIKAGQLDIPKQDLMAYIITKIFSF